MKLTYKDNYWQVFPHSVFFTNAVFAGNKIRKKMKPLWFTLKHLMEALDSLLNLLKLYERHGRL